METTTMQFDSHEGCFSQPYSCRPVDAAPTDYPRNHGIIGYLLPIGVRLISKTDFPPLQL